MRSRRETLVGALALGACAPHAFRGEGALSRDNPRFAAIEARVGGRLGVAAWDPGADRWLFHRAHERFAMCSTFKWLLAAQHLHMNDGNPGWLGQVMQFGEGDLLEYAPVAREHLSRGAMSNETMCAGAVAMSDNTCAKLLLIPAGGPAGLTQFLRARGDGVTRLDRIEPDLNIVQPGDVRDTTTPAAMAQTLHRFLATDRVLSAAARGKLIGWMVESPTGRARLRAGLPGDWRAGDKTGTWNGEPNAANDVAIAWPPGRAPIVIACYLAASTANADARNAAHAEVARLVTEDWG